MPARDEVWRFGFAMSLGIAIVVIVLAASTTRAPAQLASTAYDPVIAAAGDIACDQAAIAGAPDSCQQQATSDLLVGAGFTAVLTLGDNQYPDGTLDTFLGFYEPTWGRVKHITRPATGNHDYHTPGAAGYFSYFGAAAGPVGQGYYSYDIGAWHLIALNSNCDQVSCSPGSPQETWLASDLAAHPESCTLAYWHHPQFSSGEHGNEGGANSTAAFWANLYSAGAEVVLNGHDHDYERFAPQTPTGAADPRGIREFVVGTGGKSHRPFRSAQPNSEVRNADTFGVLVLTLHPASYEWRFVPVGGGTFSDSGTGTCRKGGRGGIVGGRVERRFELRLSGSTRARLSRGASVWAHCTHPCTVRARASVSLGRAKKAVRSRRTTRRLSAGEKVKLRLEFSSRNLRTLQGALARRKRLRATVTVAATDQRGQTRTAQRTIRLRR